MKPKCGVCGKGFQLKKNLHAICSLCNAYYHKRHPVVSMPSLSNVTSFVCHKCNNAGPPSPNPHAARFNALQGLPGHRPDESVPAVPAPVPDMGGSAAPVPDMGGSASDPSSLVTASVPVPVDMVYQDSDLESLVMEKEREMEELVNSAKVVVEQAKPSFNDRWPQFDERMKDLGFVRDPSQELTPADGDCALHAISILYLHFFQVLEDSDFLRRQYLYGEVDWRH